MLAVLIRRLNKLLADVRLLNREFRLLDGCSAGSSSTGAALSTTAVVVDVVASVVVVLCLLGPATLALLGC